MTHKILEKKSGKSNLKPGDYISIKVDQCFAHDPVIGILNTKFKGEFGKDVRVWDPKKVILFQDHLVPAKNFESRNLIKIMDAFVKEQGIEQYYQYGKNYGVCHIIILEDCLTLPGETLFGTDSHTTTAGALGAFATGVGVFDMISIWKTGEIWHKVPGTYKVELKGSPNDPSITIKDIILEVIGSIKLDGAKDMTLEWHGEYLDHLSLEERSTLCNMAVEAGATNSVMPLNKSTLEFIETRAKRDYEVFETDSKAKFDKVIEVDLEKLRPKIALPHRPDNVVDFDSIADQNIPVHQVYVGGCTGGKLSDIDEFISGMGHKDLSPNVTVIVIPATMHIYQSMLETGKLSYLIQKGVAVESPGCKACYGVHGGVTGDDENCLATINRNFIGRMGNPRSNIYLSSPWTAGKVATTGKLNIRGLND
jgi:homoaconitate hydratase family protein